MFYSHYFIKIIYKLYFIIEVSSTQIKFSSPVKWANNYKNSVISIITFIMMACDFHHSNKMGKIPDLQQCFPDPRGSLENHKSRRSLSSGMSCRSYFSLSCWCISYFCFLLFFQVFLNSKSKCQYSISNEVCGNNDESSYRSCCAIF